MKLFQNEWTAMKDAIRKLFEELNIKKVVYVDNDFEIEVYKESILLFLRENITSPDITWPFSTEAGVEYALDACTQWINDIDKRTEVIQFIKTHNIPKSENHIELFLNDIFPENSLSCLTPSGFNKEYVAASIFKPSETNRLLVLMDKHLGEGEGLDGMKLLSPFVNKDYVACGLFSNTFSTDDELQHWKDCENANNIFPLSKDRVFDEELFLEGLRNVVWLQQISEVKGYIINLYNSAFEATEKDIKSLDPASFTHAVIKCSVKEGCWEFDTMKRILLLLLDQKVEELMIQQDKFERIQSLTKQLKKITLCTVDGDQPNTKILESLYTSEIYADISYVNKTFSQIANGDIFEIKGKGRYMLSCQACNLELRDDGRRKSKDFVYLLPITSTNDDLPIYHSKLQEVSEQECEYVDLAKCVRISPNVLDLVSYNKDGYAILDINKSVEQLDNVELLQSKMRKNYEKIYSKIKQYVQVCQKIESLQHNTLSREEKTFILKMLKKPFELASERLIKLDYTKDTGIVDFHVKRVGRYKEPFAHIVLHDFSNYLSRHALPNNFSKR